MNKTIEKICSECGAKFYVRPQHVKISSRCRECQLYHNHEIMMEMQRKRRAKNKLIK